MTGPVKTFNVRCRFVLMIVLSLAFTSCLKRKETNPEAKNIRYEVSGNFTGNLTVSESQNNGSHFQYHDGVSLPWAKDTTVAYGELISLGAYSRFPGNPGEAVVLKIFSANKLVRDTTLFADSSGEILFPVKLSYRINSL
jgi:hypothetical protein